MIDHKHNIVGYKPIFVEDASWAYSNDSTIKENHLYTNIFKQIPNIIYKGSIDVVRFNEYIQNNHADKITSCYYKIYTDQEKYNDYLYIFIKEKIIVYIEYHTRIVTILFDNLEEVNNLIDFTDFIDEKNIPKFYTILTSSGGYRKLSNNLKDVDFLPENYEEDFLTYHEAVLKHMPEDKSGIHLMYGSPGTGKTSYIKSLCGLIDKTFLFIPNNFKGSLDNPEMLSFLSDNRNSILIIEDAEKVLVNREQDINSPIASLLNLSDGLLGSALNLQIICTFNTDLANIDKALLRKGRLLTSYNFKPLSIERAKNLIAKKNLNISLENSITLAEIYNQEDNGYEKKVVAKIGFKTH